jgi:lysophospholipase L1-like esterase
MNRKRLENCQTARVVLKKSRTDQQIHRVLYRNLWFQVVASIMFCVASDLISAQTQTVYRPPVPPPENSATFPAPRDDWYATVQEKFDRYSGKPADIIFDGDSITNRWEITGKSVWSQYFAGSSADFGIEGDRIENLLWRLDKGEVAGINPKVVVLLIGTNNVGRNSANQISSGIKAVVLEYEALCPNAHIILMAVFPRGKAPNDGNRLKLAAVNKQIAALDDGDRVSFVDIGPKLMEKDGMISPDMMPDFVHPTERGYLIWADAIKGIVDKYTKKKH